MGVLFAFSGSGLHMDCGSARTLRRMSERIDMVLARVLGGIARRAAPVAANEVLGPRRNRDLAACRLVDRLRERGGDAAPAGPAYETRDLPLGDPDAGRELCLPDVVSGEPRAELHETSICLVAFESRGMACPQE
jgi:hypothetical protein